MRTLEELRRYASQDFCSDPTLVGLKEVLAILLRALEGACYCGHLLIGGSWDCGRDNLMAYFIKRAQEEPPVRPLTTVVTDTKIPEADESVCRICFKPFEPTICPVCIQNRGPSLDELAQSQGTRLAATGLTQKGKEEPMSQLGINHDAAGALAFAFAQDKERDEKISDTLVGCGVCKLGFPPSEMYAIDDRYICQHCAEGSIKLVEDFGGDVEKIREVLEAAKVWAALWNNSKPGWAEACVRLFTAVAALRKEEG